MDYDFLSQSSLFKGASPDEVRKILSCLASERKLYGKGSVIYHAGDSVKAMGVVLSGTVHVESIDLLGNKSILSRISGGQVFGETYACIPEEKMMVSVTAAEDSDILFLDIRKVIKTCSNV